MAPIGSYFGRFLKKLEQATQPNVPEVYLERLEEALKLPLPPGLTAPPPRPDVWLRRGYLAQYPYATQYKPLLIHGRVTRGIVYEYESSEDPSGYNATARYAWFERPGHLRDAGLRESYDGVHAAFGKDKALDTKILFVDMEAQLRLGRVVTIVHDESRHVIFEALRTDVVHAPEAPRADIEATKQAGMKLGPTPADDMEQLFDDFLLKWEVDKKGPLLHFGQKPAIQTVPYEPMGQLRPDATEPGGWRLSRMVPRPVRPWLHSVPVRSASGTTVWRILGEEEDEVGRAELRGEHLVVTHRGTSVRLSLDGRGGWRAENDQGQPRLSCERLPQEDCQRLPMQGHFRVSIEVLLLALASVGRPWSPL